MRAACPPLLGLHDFAGFCKKREGATTVRTLLHLDWSRRAGRGPGAGRAGRRVLPLHGPLARRGLLHGGRRPRRTTEFPTRLLSGRARVERANVAPARGLTLLEVGYPPPGDLAARQEETRARRPDLPDED